MKQYKSIDYWNKGIFGSPIIAFDKLDGSNIDRNGIENNQKIQMKDLINMEPDDN